MKRFSSLVVMSLVMMAVSFFAADSASAAGRLRRSRNSCDCTSCAEPACGATEPACCAAEPACGAEPACAAAEPACGAAEPACCSQPRRRRGRVSRRGSDCCKQSCTSCCSEPACSADPACNAG